MVGLAERGQRLVEEPLVGLDQFGLDPYVDPGYLNLYWAGWKSHRQTFYPVIRITKIDDQGMYICQLTLLS